jgi:hypothetical protein
VGDARAAQPVHRTGGHEGPTIHFDRPRQDPPPLASFVSPLGRPRVCAMISRNPAQIADDTVERILFLRQMMKEKELACNDTGIHRITRWKDIWQPACRGRARVERLASRSFVTRMISECALML